MIVTREFCEQWFPHYNKEFFNGELPTPTFVLIKTKTVLGQFQCCRRLDAFANPYRQFVIRMSQYYDRPEHDLKETLVHEMIHYFISYKNIQDTGSHGKIWKKMAEEINSKSSFHISRTTSVEGCKANTDDKKINIFVCERPTGLNFIFFCGDTSVEKYDNAVKSLIKNKSFISAKRGTVMRSEGFGNYSLCRTTIKGFNLTDGEIAEKITPYIKNVVIVNV